VRVVFEVLSPDSGRRDRIEKAGEYATVPSILHYVIMESARASLLVIRRQRGNDAWTALTLTGGDTLSLPEIGVEIPVAEFYEDMDFDDTAAGG
jgi:Uma2 family endonuclease